MASAARSTAKSSSLRSAAGEALEHEVRRVLPARRAADAEAHAQVVLRAQRRADRAQPVVPALAAALLQAHDAEAEVEVVVHHDQSSADPK